MRLDKFLKISLLFKTRSSGEKAIENNNVKVNGSIAKSSLKVKEEDEIEITFPFKVVTYKINFLSEKTVPKKTAREMTTIIKEVKNDI